MGDGSDSPSMLVPPSVLFRLCTLPHCPTVPSALLRSQASRDHDQAHTQQEPNSMFRVYGQIFDGCFSVVWS